MLYSSDAWPGRVYKLSLEGKVLGVLGQSGKQLKQFGWIHAMACPSKNVLYVAELLNWRVQKLIFKPDPTSSRALAKRSLSSLTLPCATLCFSSNDDRTYVPVARAKSI